MALQLVVDNTKTGASVASGKRTDLVKNIAEFSIVRIAGFTGMLNKQHAEYPFIEDNHGAQTEVYLSDEVEIVCTHRELAAYWLKGEKPTPNYPLALRRYDKECRWICGETCDHQYKWTCPTCEGLIEATGEEFGRFYSRNGDCLDCKRADAEKDSIQQTADGNDSQPSTVFDYFQQTTGN